MPTAAGFPALFEVAAMSVALTIACIGGCRYAARCLRSSSPLHLSGLAASLLTIFFCVYGLAYWFNGSDGYNCASFSTTMGTSLSASTAVTFVHFFMLSDSLNQTSTRWSKLRWLGVVITAIYCGSLVTVEVTRTASEMGMGGGGSQSSAVAATACFEESRCDSGVDNGALIVKWTTQLLNQMFQAAALFVPLWSRLEGTARSRVFSGIIRSTGDYRKGLVMPVWLFIAFEAVSLAVTVLVASLMLAKAQGRFDSTPAFAVEVFDNAANLIAVFFSADAIPLPEHLHDDPKDPRRLFHSSALSGNKSRSLNGTTFAGSGTTFGGSASSLGNDSSGGGGGQPLGGTGRFNGYTAGGVLLTGNNGSFGDNGGRVGNGSGYHIRRRPDGSLVGSYDSRGGRLGGGARAGGRFGIGGRHPRAHSTGLVSSTPSFSSFTTSSLQRRRNSESFVRRLPPLIDTSPAGRDKTDSSSSTGRESRSRSRSRSKSSSRSSRSPPVCAPSPSSVRSGGAPSPTREDAAPVQVSPSTSATPSSVDGNTAAADGDPAEAVAAQANGATPGRKGRPLGALYFSSRVAKKKSRLTRAGSSGEGTPISDVGKPAMQNPAALTGSSSGQPTSASEGAGRVPVEQRSVSATSVSADALREHDGGVGAGAGGSGGVGGVGDGGDGGGGAMSVLNGGGGADDGGGGGGGGANSNSAPSGNPGGAISTTPAAVATNPDDASSAVLSENTRTVVTLSPWKWQGPERQDQEQQALPRPRPTNRTNNSNNNRIRPRTLNAPGTVADANGYERREEARGATRSARNIGTPAFRIAGSQRHHEITSAAAAVAGPGTIVSAQQGRRFSAMSRLSRVGTTSDSPASSTASPGTAAAAVAVAAHTVLWPLALKDVSSSDSCSPSPHGGRRSLRFPGLRFASSSSLTAAESAAEEKERGQGAAVVPGWARRQEERHKKQGEASRDGHEKLGPAAPVTPAIAAAAAAMRGAGLSTYLGGSVKVDIEAAKAARVAATAAASTAGARLPLEVRSSSSGTCRSGASGVARSAFSAASWYSSNFGGDDASRGGAPASTVRSPASYFDGNCNGT